MSATKEAVAHSPGGTSRVMVLLKVGLAFFAIGIVAWPIVSPRSGWHVSEGLLVVAAIFLFYGCCTLAGKLLQKDACGFRLGLIDLVLIGAFPLYLLYIGNERFHTSVDNQATRYLAPLLWNKQTLDLSTEPPFRGRTLPYSAIRVKEKVYSSFPLGTAFLAAPFAGGFESFAGPSHERLSLIWEKHFAAIITVTGVCLFFLALRRRYGEQAATGSSLVLAVATPVLSCASQALWSFTGELFFTMLGLLLLQQSRKNHWRCIAAGIAVGLAFFCRPTGLLIGGIFFLVLLKEERGAALRFAAALAATGAMVSVFLYWIYSHPLGGYGVINQGHQKWDVSVLSGLSGVLFNPSRGLVAYFPYLVPAIFLWKRIKGEDRIWFAASLLGVCAFVSVAATHYKWWGGHSLGPRLLTEAAPFLAILTVPLWLQWKDLRWRKWLMMMLLTFSAFTQVLSIYNPVASSWNTIADVDTHPENRWSWRNSQLAATWVPGWEYDP